MSANQATSDSAQRLLQTMHAVCSHDLPNQAVALESLLHLFVMDESDHLSAQAQEYLQRLQSVAGKITAMARFLRELARLQRHQFEMGEIVCSRFITELKAELQRQLPEHQINITQRLAVDGFRSDRRLLLTGLSALVQAASQIWPTGVLHLEFVTSQKADAVECRLVVRPPANVAGSGLSATTNCDRRLEYALGREFLARADITCRLDEAVDALAFVLTIPPRSAHG